MIVNPLTLGCRILRLLNGAEQVLVEKLFTHRAIESLNASVLLRISRLGKPKHNGVLICHSVGTGVPSLACLRIAMIWLPVYLLVFM
jgi:hypothetical protein